MKCDIFISYRRDGGDMTAMYIYQALKEKGYDVFFDLEVLRAGKFNDALRENIRACKDFVLILSPHALDRCSDENDWVRKEIAEALRCKKNIIPVMLNGFTFPESLPADIDDVRYQNGLSATTEYFMESVNRLCSRYLNAKPRKKTSAVLITCICVAILALICCSFLGWMLLKKPETSNVAVPVSAPIETALPTAEPTTEPAAEPTAIPVLRNTNLPRLREDRLSGIYDGNWSERPVLGNENLARWEISSVSFVPSMEGMAQDAWNVSEDNSGSIKAWVVRNGGLYDLFIGAEGGVTFTNTSEFFCGYENMKSVSFNGCVDFSCVTDASAMFEFCSSLESIDLSGLDTSNVTNMMVMFRSCSSLKSIDLSMIDTANVENMSMMFDECTSLESINLSGVDTSHVQDMSKMFRYCHSLTELDVSSFDTIRVQNMSNMFEACENLTSLDLNNWNTSHVTNLESMFQGCYKLEELNVSSWNTANVDNMRYLFFECGSLRELDLSGWNTGKVFNMESLFDCCYTLQSLVLPDGFVGPSVNITVHMFMSCNELTSINTRNWDTSAVFDMTGMFENCRSLPELDISGWNTQSLENMSFMFSNCHSLQSLDFSGWDVSKVTSMLLTFHSCAALQELDLSGLDTSNVTTFEATFEACPQLHSLWLPDNFVTANAVTTRAMFNDCHALQEVNVSGWDVSNVTDMSYMFHGCEQLKSLDISGWNMENVLMENTFEGCGFQPA